MLNGYAIVLVGGRKACAMARSFGACRGRAGAAFGKRAGRLWVSVICVREAFRGVFVGMNGQVFIGLPNPKYLAWRVSVEVPRIV